MIIVGRLCLRGRVAMAGRALVAAFALAALLPAGAAQARYVVPVDHARTDRALLAAREHLIAVLKRRDFIALVPLIAGDADIGSAKAGGAGPLIAWLRREPGLWDELAKALALGGRKTGRDQFDAPYTQFATLRGVVAEEVGVVIARNVPAHELATGKARIMARYSVETAIVKRWWVEDVHGAAPQAGAPPAEPWVEIELPSKRRGYMLKRYVRWVHGPRVGFTRRGGRWLVTSVQTGPP